MKRLCIVSVYDKDGIADDYLFYLIDELRNNMDKLEVVINGYMKPEYKKRIENKADVVWTRKNSGFDAGAYKYALNQTGADEIGQYDELVLCNDTFYGPFIPLKDILITMEKHKVDFWGLDFTRNNIVNFMHSYFLVFQEKLLKNNVVYRYFQENINEDENDVTYVYAAFETGLTNYLMRENYRFDCFSFSDNYNPYKSSNFCVCKYKVPIMKKKCFASGYYDEANIMEALQYIVRNTGYDIELILQNAKRVYSFKKTKREILDIPVHSRVEYKIPESSKNPEIILDFLKSHKRIYIYGAGRIAKRIWFVYKEYMGNVQGFCVSDREEIANKYIGKFRIYKLHEIEDAKRSALLAAVNPEITEDIRDSLTDFKEVMYLWE